MSLTTCCCSFLMTMISLSSSDPNLSENLLMREPRSPLAILSMWPYMPSSPLSPIFASLRALQRDSKSPSSVASDPLDHSWSNSPNSVVLTGAFPPPIGTSASKSSVSAPGGGGGGGGGGIQEGSPLTGGGGGGGGGRGWDFAFFLRLGIIPMY